METMKKSYHSACKEEKLAASRETNGKLESNNNPESQKKLQEKVEKCQQEVEKVGLPLERHGRCIFLEKLLKILFFPSLSQFLVRSVPRNLLVSLPYIIL